MSWGNEATGMLLGGSCHSGGARGNLGDSGNDSAKCKSIQTGTTADWTYVREGTGNSLEERNYAGAGTASDTKDPVAPRGHRLWRCVLAPLPLLLLPFLVPDLLSNKAPLTRELEDCKRQPGGCSLCTTSSGEDKMCCPAEACEFNTTTATITTTTTAGPEPVTTTTSTPYGPMGKCSGWGDPHIRTFDGNRSDYYSSGEYYLVNCSLISIQGRYGPTEYTNGLAVTKEVGIGGPLLKGNKLIIAPLAATWNGAPILQGRPSQFQQPGIVTIHFDDIGQLVDTTGGVDPSKKQIVHINISDGSPEGLYVQVNRWTQSPGNEYVNWMVQMHSRPGCDGHCGNFNGNGADDDRLDVHRRIGIHGVPDGPLLVFAKKTPIVIAPNRPHLQDCPTATMDNAKADCKAAYDHYSKACLEDYCFAGKEVALDKV